ncbi:hypothetical protein DYGSA30_32830 [Dyella sp. GSA-30]|nr:hypothetical protein DYGSA30_32720 [Dyella sp. GSA-30]BDU21826.1 hypothetical protein DYGSA30_32830 [Dyella sp. GSA-30]
MLAHLVQTRSIDRLPVDPRLRDGVQISIDQCHGFGLSELLRRQLADEDTLRLPRQPVFQLRLQRLERIDHQGEARRHRLPPHLKRIGEISQAGITHLRRGDGHKQLLHPFAQHCHRLGGQHHQNRLGCRFAWGGLDGLDILLDHHVRVHATETERTDTGTARQGYAAVVDLGRPRLRLVDNEERAVVQRDTRIEFLIMHQRRKRLMLHAQDRLDHAGQAGHRFEMPDIGLDAGDTAGLFVQDFAAIGRDASEGQLQPLHFDRVALGRAGTVRLDVTDTAHGHIGLTQGRGNHVRLCQRTGIGHRAGTATVIDRGAA